MILAMCLFCNMCVCVCVCVCCVWWWVTGKSSLAKSMQRGLVISDSMASEWRKYNLAVLICMEDAVLLCGKQPGIITVHLLHFPL